jgi:hypothetical protein
VGSCIGEDAGASVQVEDNLCAGQSHIRSCVERHDREDDLLWMLQQEALPEDGPYEARSKLEVGDVDMYMQTALGWVNALYDSATRQLPWQGRVCILLAS